MSWDGINPI